MISDTPTNQQHISIPNTAEDAMAQRLLRMPKSQAVVTLATKSAKRTHQYRGPLDEARTSSNASASTTANGWTRSEKRDAELKAALESTRSWVTSTLPPDAVSVTEICTFTT